MTGFLLHLTHLVGITQLASLRHDTYILRVNQYYLAFFGLYTGGLEDEVNFAEYIKRG